MSWKCEELGGTWADEGGWGSAFGARPLGSVAAVVEKLKKALGHTDKSVRAEVRWGFADASTTGTTDN